MLLTVERKGRFRLLLVARPLPDAGRVIGWVDGSTRRANVELDATEPHWLTAGTRLGYRGVAYRVLGFRWDELRVAVLARVEDPLGGRYEFMVRDLIRAAHVVGD